MGTIQGDKVNEQKNRTLKKGEKGGKLRRW